MDVSNHDHSSLSRKKKKIMFYPRTAKEKLNILLCGKGDIGKSEFLNRLSSMVIYNLITRSLKKGEELHFR